MSMRARWQRHAARGVAAAALLIGCGTAGTTTTPTGGGPAPARTTALVTTPDTTAAPPKVAALAYAVYDSRSDRVLAADDGDARLPVGSLMKLLNAVVAYRAGEPDRPVVAPDGLGGDVEESVIGISAGQTISRAVLIRAMLKVSANDAARLLAIDIGGSEDRYAEMMNAAAEDLGLTNTRARNATGLDAEDQYSSANDLIALGLHLFDDPTFRQTVSEPTAMLNGQMFSNTNDLLGAYAGADGIKTGHTTGAGWCIMASATRGNRQIVAVVLGAPTEADRDASARALLDWGFAQP